MSEVQRVVLDLEGDIERSGTSSVPQFVVCVLNSVSSTLDSLPFLVVSLHAYFF